MIANFGQIGYPEFLNQKRRKVENPNIRIENAYNNMRIRANMRYDPLKDSERGITPLTNKEEVTNVNVGRQISLLKISHQREALAEPVDQAREISRRRLNGLNSAANSELHGVARIRINSQIVPYRGPGVHNGVFAEDNQRSGTIRPPRRFQAMTNSVKGFTNDLNSDKVYENNKLLEPIVVSFADDEVKAMYDKDTTKSKKIRTRTRRIRGKKDRSCMVTSALGYNP